MEAAAGSLLAVLDLTGCRLDACGLLERVLHHLRIFLFMFYVFISLHLADMNSISIFQYLIQFSLGAPFIYCTSPEIPSSEAAYVDQRVGYTTMGG